MTSIHPFCKFLNITFFTLQFPTENILLRVLVFEEDFMVTQVFQDFPESLASLIEVRPKAEDSFYFKEQFFILYVAPALFNVVK